MELHRRRIYILPTGSGLLYALVLLVMLLGAINYDLSLGHALVFLLAGLGLVAMVHTLGNLLHLTLEAGSVAPVFAGEAAQLQLHLQAPPGRPRRALEVDGGHTTAGAGLANDGRMPARLQLAVALAPRPRGWHELPRLRIASTYPLGLFRAWAYYRPAGRQLVYPAPLESPLPPRQAALGEDSLQGEGGQEDFAGLRLRQPADPLRHIAWKAAARFGQDRPLAVKHFAGGAEEQVWLDWAALPAEADLETRLSLLAGWVLAAQAAGLSFGLRLPGREVPRSRDGEQAGRCLELLARWPAPGEERP